MTTEVEVVKDWAWCKLKGKKCGEVAKHWAGAN